MEPQQRAADLPEEFDDEELAEPSGLDELFFAAAQTLRTKRTKDAVAALIEKYAEEMPVNAKRRHRAMLWSYGFTLTILAVVGLLGWLGIINHETAGAMLGTVIGSIFYNRRSDS